MVPQEGRAVARVEAHDEFMRRYREESDERARVNLARADRVHRQICWMGCACIVLLVILNLMM